MTRWRTVAGHEGLYEVSDDGQVLSLRSNEILKPGVHPPGGHMAVSLYGPAPGSKAQEYVHRLVAEAFIPNPEGHPFVRHLDDNAGNNRVENLAWGTRSDNGHDAVRNGINPNAAKTHCKRGHEFTPKNTRMNKGWRYCRACGAEFARNKRAAKKELEMAA